MQRPASTEEEESDHPVNSRDEPQQHIDEINPDGVFHALDPAVSLRVLVDVHVAEEAEERGEEDAVTVESANSPLRKEEAAPA